MTSYADLLAQVRRTGLDIFGGFHPTPEDCAPAATKTLLLLGPHEPGFWQRVRSAPEFNDGEPDPLDRWSSRVVGALAHDLNADAVFPFGGPPFAPFISWATRTGRAWQSPVTLLVHDRAGLMVSYRGALALPEPIDLPETGPCPCDTCEMQPCRTACPVNALTSKGYDIPACTGYLSTGDGKRSCMAGGCHARLACPISERYERDPAQSAYHMSQFLK